MGFARAVRYCHVTCAVICIEGLTVDQIASFGRCNGSIDLLLDPLAPAAPLAYKNLKKLSRMTSPSLHSSWRHAGPVNAGRPVNAPPGGAGADRPPGPDPERVARGHEHATTHPEPRTPRYIRARRPPRRRAGQRRAAAARGHGGGSRFDARARAGPRAPYAPRPARRGSAGVGGARSYRARRRPRVPSGRRGGGRSLRSSRRLARSYGAPLASNPDRYRPCACRVILDLFNTRCMTPQRRRPVSGLGAMGDPTRTCAPACGAIPTPTTRRASYTITTDECHLCVGGGPRTEDTHSHRLPPLGGPAIGPSRPFPPGLLPSAHGGTPARALTPYTSGGVAPHRRRVHRSIAWPRWRRRRCPRAAARCA